MAAAAVVSVSMGVMKPVLAKLATLMGDEYKKIKGLRKEVTFLQRELGDMDALLEKMDSADELDPQAKKWRRDIIEMSYNIEDRIDDFMHTVGEPDDKIGILRKAAKCLRSFNDRRRLANDFQEIKTQVMEASDRRKRYMLDQCISITGPVIVDPRVSALYKESTSLVGIEAQKGELVNWAADEDKQLKFMAIVGFGGIGKTTLANEVYREVGGKFECKAFISVSQKPQMIELFNSLLSQVGQRTYCHNTSHLPDPINDLRRHLQDKRYFIVVDDLWEREEYEWDAIKCAFPPNNYCSRVIITTRNEKVAERCCGTSGIVHKMKPLSEPDSRKLFFTRIFESEHDCPPQFVEVSCAILKRCGGLPLAILTVAGILASQKTNLRGAWEYIRTELAPQVETNDVDYETMMDILDLSYKHLPRHLKTCFLYFGTYPEDHIIEKAGLVRRWVAEGFVSASTEQNVWDVGESYLNELVNRSMIQPVENMFAVYRVHDMMLDLIIRKCKEDNFLSFINTPEAMASAMKDKVIRRLTVDLRGIHQGGPMLMTTTAGNLSHARSVTMFNGVSNRSIPLLLELKFVRVLWLHLVSGVSTGVNLFGNINHLSHLRYLKVQGSCTMELPLGEIRGLRLLETLDLSELYNFHIPLDLVDVPRLSHLRTLSGISLPSSSLESIQGLGELTGLTELSLFSEPSPTATWMVALCTSLEKLGKLRLLEVPLCYGFIAHRADPLSLLSPPFGSSLERLNLWYWTFTNVPRWVGHLQCLQELSLGAKQIIQQDVAIIGMLPKLIIGMLPKLISKTLPS